MSTKSTVRRFIEKMLSDDVFFKEIAGARSHAEAKAICDAAGLTQPFTKAELDAELGHLKQAAGELVEVEEAVTHEGTQARWVARLARLGGPTADAETPV